MHIFESDHKTLSQRSQQAVWHPCTQMKHHEQWPIVPISHGEGVWLTDTDGKRYLDAVSSWWVNLFGHNNLRIKNAIKQQLDTLEHVILAGFTHEPVVQLSEKLAALTGLGHAFYASDGASATEIALKMSFHYWRNLGLEKKTQFISLQNSYHGETLGALSVTDVAIFKASYGQLLRPSAQMPSPDFRLANQGVGSSAGSDENAEAYALRCADLLQEYVKAHHESLAAFIIEPLIQCAAGMGMYHPIYLKRAREICNTYQVHLIADEIAVGFGRTGTMFACEQANIIPDFMCLSKGITGGYLPLSVVLCRNEIYEAFYNDDVARGFLHSHSYTGNPLACSAALATLAIFEDEHILHKNQQTAAKITTKMQVLAHLPIYNLRHQGMIWAFEIASDQTHFSKTLYTHALSLGLLLRPIGNTVYFMPPYVINDAEIDFMISAACKAIELSL